jgi:hypothetical protein
MTSKPAWASAYPTYEEIVDSWGYVVHAFETFGSYQGDHVALIEGEPGVGLIVFGYGSCSGCDELEAIAPYGEDEDWQPVIDFAARLREGVHWEPSRGALRDWVNARPENHWWSCDEEIARWLNATLGTSLKVEP